MLDDGTSLLRPASVPTCTDMLVSVVKDTQQPISLRGKAHLVGLVLPGALKESLSPKRLPRRALSDELSLHKHLSGNAGMIRPGEPKGRAPTHSMEPVGRHVNGLGHTSRLCSGVGLPREDVLEGNKHGVTHVELASDVGGRHRNRVGLLRRWPGFEVTR